MLERVQKGATPSAWVCAGASYRRELAADCCYSPPALRSKSGRQTRGLGIAARRCTTVGKAQVVDLLLVRQRGHELSEARTGHAADQSSRAVVPVDGRVGDGCAAG